MDNKIDNSMDAFCTVCGKITCFCFDGEDWECQTCESLNTQADYKRSKKSKATITPKAANKEYEDYED